MGLLDKLKNLFTDEEEVEVVEELEEPKKEEPAKLPTFMREKIAREENIIEPEPVKQEEQVSDRELVNHSNSFKFPIAFDDTDFETTTYSTQNVITRVKEEPKKPVELYKKKEEPKKEEHRFKATPIISPVYGILDKNYKKEELKAKPESKYEIPRASKKIDFESVRMKAYGTLDDEIKNNLLADDLVVEASKVNVVEDNLLYDVTDSKEDISLGDAEDNYYDFGVSYEIPKQEIDIKDNSDVKIVNHNEDVDVKASKIEVKEPEEVIDLGLTEEDKKDTVVVSDVADTKTDTLELTDDLFSLIDSMYDEREDK